MFTQGPKAAAASVINDQTERERRTEARNQEREQQRQERAEQQRRQKEATAAR